LLLELNKLEVEKLVSTALNEKLLKKLNIKNLAQIDKVSKLEIEIAELRLQLDEANLELRNLRSAIEKAAALLTNL